MKILLAEDEQPVREVTRLVLAEAGHDVVAVCDGVEAIARHRDLSPDLMILDMVMPRCSGIEALRVMRAEGNLADTVIFTGYDLELAGITINDLDTLNVCDIWCKPLTGQQLLDMIGTIHGSHFSSRGRVGLCRTHQDSSRPLVA